MSFPYLTDLINWTFGTDWNLPIPTFGILVAVGIMAAAYFAQKEVERKAAVGTLPASTRDIFSNLILISVLAGIVGARVLAIVEHADQFFANPASMIFTRNGFSIYGGLIFGIAAGVLFLKRHRIPILPMLDAIAPSLMLGYGIGRLGCQISGDGDWGIAANMALKPSWLPDWLWAQTYTGNIVGVTIAEPGVYPTPLYEFLAALLLFGTLYWLRSSWHRPGYLFSAYLLLAGFERLLIEKIRVNVRYEMVGLFLTQAELISLAIIIAGLIGILLTLRTETRWRFAFSLGALAALSACMPQ